MCVAFLAGKCCYAQPVQYYCFAQVFQASYGLYYWWRWTLEPCWFFLCFPVSLRVAEAEVGVLRQDVHIVITTEPESAADLQDIIGRYSFGLNYLWVQCDPSNVSRLQVQFKVWWSFCWSFVLTKRTCSVPLSPCCDDFTQNSFRIELCLFSFRRSRSRSPRRRRRR